MIQKTKILIWIAVVGILIASILLINKLLIPEIQRGEIITKKEKITITTDKTEYEQGEK